MSARYVCFADAQKEQVRRTDFCGLLRSQGETLKRSDLKYEWKDESQKVIIRGNLWFHQYDREGDDGGYFLCESSPLQSNMVLLCYRRVDDYSSYFFVISRR